MSSTSSHGRQSYTNQVILDQVDYFQTDGFTRVVGLQVSDVTPQLFFNNVLQPWTLVTGNGIPDPQVVSGKVYFNEIAGQPGNYSVRFRPNSVGFWRLLLTYTVGQQIAAQDFDVIPVPPTIEQGLKSSFTKPSC